MIYYYNVITGIQQFFGGRQSVCLSSEKRTRRENETFKIVNNDDNNNNILPITDDEFDLVFNVSTNFYTDHYLEKLKIIDFSWFSRRDIM